MKLIMDNFLAVFYSCLALFMTWFIILEVETIGSYLIHFAQQ